MTKIDEIRKKVEDILHPLKPAMDINSFLYYPRPITDKKLSTYYLVYFLFGELLGYKNLGQFEKIAWSFPVRYKDKLFTIDHRKFGVGVFVPNPETDSNEAEELIEKINSAIKISRPFFDLVAEKAVASSELNVINRNEELYNRFIYLKKQYSKEYKLYLKKKDKRVTKTKESKSGTSTTIINLGGQHYYNSNYLAISCIEAFYSWTEHLFIHLAIIQEGMHDGIEIAKLIGAEWKVKYKAAITSNSKESNEFYNDLILVRQQLRNFVAHGAFGKEGNAFKFHSNAGAVPVLMSHKRNKNKFSLHGFLTFNNVEVIALIDNFINYLQEGDLKAAMIYAQIYALPSILPYAQKGDYRKAIKSPEIMDEFCWQLMKRFDDSANMDW